MGDARAGDAASTIAVVSDKGDRFAMRIVAELEALGFRVVVAAPAPAPISRASLEAAAGEAGALAAIRAVPTEHGVEVWIADRVTGKTVLREVSSDEHAADPTAELALHAVELLRASLLEVAVPEAPRGAVPATPAIRARMQIPPASPHFEERSPTLRLSVAPGVLWSPGGLGPGASLDLGLAWTPTRHFGAVALVAVPLVSPQVTSVHDAARADLSALIAGGGGRFLFTAPERRWVPSADVGAAAVWLRSTGTAGVSSSVVCAPFVRFGVAFAPWTKLRLRADVLASVIVQGVSVQLVGRDAATWGLPIVLASAGADVGWF
jgi:hypothetical protein